MEGDALMIENASILEEFWRQWFRERPHSGREIFKVYSYDQNGNPNGSRLFYSDFSAFKEYLHWTKANRRPCWLSVQPFLERDSVTTVEKLFFDFDSQDLELTWKETSQFAETLRKSYGAEPLSCFSGRKGYHVYVFLRENAKFPTVEEAKKFYSTAQRMILKGLKLETLDKQVIGDIKRVARVPYSIHEKSLQLCTPVTENRQPCWVMDLYPFRKHGLNRNFVDLCKRKAEENPRRRQGLWRPHPRQGKGIRPCFQEALNANLSGISGHKMRLAIAVEYLNNGYTAEQTAQLFQNQTDFLFDKSLEYIQDAEKRNYKRFKCQSIRELGFCLPNCGRKKP
jgi:hypothetical protein